MVRSSSVRELLAMLEEANLQPKVDALSSLVKLVDEFWAEIRPSVAVIESLSHDQEIDESQRQLAALLLSKVFFHCNQLDHSLSHVLRAGPLFDVAEHSSFVRCLTAKAIDAFVGLKSKAAESNAEAESGDPKLDAFVQKILNKCIRDGKNKQVIGVANECRRLDILEEAISKSDNIPETLLYCMKISHAFNDREYRREVLSVLIKVNENLNYPDYSCICQCLFFLNKPDDVASILEKLLRSGNKDDALVAKQIAFDLIDNEHQAFLLNLRNCLSAPKCRPSESTLPGFCGAANIEISQEDLQMTDGSSTSNVSVCEDPNEEMYSERLTELKGILSGETPLQLTVESLCSNNKSNAFFLKTAKQLLKMKKSSRTGIVYAAAIMHAGTSVDSFLTENMELLNISPEPVRFGSKAGLGVIHRGHLKHGRVLMEPYLSEGGAGGTGCQYSKGGALYALGLIYANNGEDIKQFLRDNLVDRNINVRHGACLGLGLAALGTADVEIYNDLQTVLLNNRQRDAEAAAISMGLLMVGTGTEKASEMLDYAHDEKHKFPNGMRDSIISGLSLGIALMVYGREEEADTLIRQMTRDEHPLLRQGGMYAFALAYRGTENNKAILQLLNFTNSDASPDVRRTAVLALGFILYHKPEQLAQIASRLCKSVDPQVRYGAALAVGISCAGTGLSEAISLLDPLTSDGNESVRHGAFIAKAMVLINISEASDPRVGAFRQALEKMYWYEINKKGGIKSIAYETALGIIIAGGHNMTIRLHGKTTHKATAIVGLMVFVYGMAYHPNFSWHVFYAYFLSLALSPVM